MKIIAALSLLVLPLLSFAQDGTFSGSAKGKRGDVAVDVVVEKGKIADIIVTSTKEDARYVYPRLKPVIIENNNYNVDVVSGASLTSRAYRDAIGRALKDAGLDQKLKGPLLKAK